MYNIELIGTLPANPSPLDIVRRIGLSGEYLLSKNRQWQAAAWQMAINYLARTQLDLELPPFEVVRVGWGRSTHDDGRLVAAVRPTQGHRTEMVLVYLPPKAKQPPRLICREAVGDEFTECLKSLAGSEPINGIQFAAIETRAFPSQSWGENLGSARDWLNAHNEQVDIPGKMPVERFELVAVAYQRQYSADTSWLVAHVRSERSGIDMVLEYCYGGYRDVIRCRVPKIGELGARCFSRSF
jgi:hypothetical protein